MTEHETSGADVGAADPIRYVAGWNMPGYLPETEPETFDTIEDAAQYLQETVERWADEDGGDYAPMIERGATWAEGWYSPPGGRVEYHLWAEEATE